MDKYHIFNEIGSGKNSQVFKGRQKKTVTYVAVKRVEKGQMSKVVNEVQMMHALRHPHALKFFDWYETRNNLWLILEYCSGGDLKSLLRVDRQLPVPAVTLFGGDLLAGLQYLHHHGVLYCDLKPSNVLVDDHGVLKLAGFGLARRIPTLTNKVKAPKNRGTPYYMSPELFVKDGVHSYQSDLWSLGCVLYELSTGRAPFEAAALPDLMRKISSTEPDFDESVFLATEADPEPSVTIETFAAALKLFLAKAPLDRPSWSEVRGGYFADVVPKPPDRPLPPQPLFDALARDLALASTPVEAPAKRPRESGGSTKSDDPLRVSIAYRDRRRTKTEDDALEMSLGDDGATAASPPTEQGAWYESGLTTSTEVEGDLLNSQADGQVKPIVGAALAAQREPCDETTLPFAPETQASLASVEHDALEKHLVKAYKALVHDDDPANRKNVIAYLAARCEVSHVANVVVNSSFVTLLLKLARKRDMEPGFRRQLLVLLGLLVRHATYVVPDAADDAALAPTLARVATDSEADLGTRCLALAALGELLFYVATQEDEEEDALAQSDSWRVDPVHAQCVLDHIGHAHEELACYACRTLENVLAQASSKRAAAFLIRPERTATALAKRVGELSPLSRAALGALAQLLRALRRFDLSSPAIIQHCSAGLDGPIWVATRCADALRASDDARWQLAHLNVLNSLLRSRDGLACAAAPGLAAALARALAGGRGLSANARAKCAAALARICELAPAAAASTETGRDGGLVAALERVASRDAHELRADAHLERCVRALAVGVAAAAVRSVKDRVVDALPLAARAAASPLLKGAVVSAAFLGDVSTAVAKCVAADDPALIAQMPAVLDALVARDGSVLLPFADHCAAAPRGLFVVALDALATFAPTVLDDAHADLARACAQLIRHTLPSCRRSTVQTILADHLPRAATALLRGGCPHTEALVRCLVEVEWAGGDAALVEELRRVNEATTLGGLAAQLLR